MSIPIPPCVAGQTIQSTDTGWEVSSPTENPSDGLAPVVESAANGCPIFGNTPSEQFFGE